MTVKRIESMIESNPTGLLMIYASLGDIKNNQRVRILDLVIDRKIQELIKNRKHNA